MKGFPRQLRLVLASALAFGLVACGGSSVTNVSIGGTISGFTGGTLTLTNGLSAMTLNSGATAFVFPARVPIGVTYSVGVNAQPVGLTCLVANGYGVAISTDISNVAITCAKNNNLGGTITGLTAPGLKLANGNKTLDVAANSTSFVFADKVMTGSTYGVTVLNQPEPQTCIITSFAGTMGPDDVNTVAISCK